MEIHRYEYDPRKAEREQKIFDSVTKTSDAIIQNFKNHGTGKTRNKKTHLQPKKKKRR